jgi:hypothetical protein
VTEGKLATHLFSTSNLYSPSESEQSPFLVES